MNKLLTLTLTFLLFLLLAIMGIFLFTFSQTGNEFIKPYIKQKLEQEIGLPVEIRKFKLESDVSRLEIVVNQQLMLRVVANYSLWTQSFKGIYHLKADNFIYNDMQLRQADIKGNISGVAENIYVDGKGKALDAMIDYRLRVLDNIPQKLELKMKDVALGEILQLAGQPALLQGMMDIDINMPDISADAGDGYGHIVIDKAYFNHALVKKLYGYALPENSYLKATVDARIKGKKVELSADAQSNLFALQIKDALFNISSKEIVSDYHLDVKDMRILSQNKLAGTFKVEGEVKVKDKEVKVTGESHSLGGNLHFSVGKTSKITFEKIALESLLLLTKQAKYATGEMSGTVVLNDSSMHSGSYRVHLDKGRLETKTITKMFGYKIPQNNSFSLDSSGKIAEHKLSAKVTVDSTLADMTLYGLKYDLEHKTLVSNYNLRLHDVKVFVPEAKVAKNTKISAKGVLKFTDRLHISGVTKSLGKSLTFDYDSKTAKIDARQLFIQKILTLSGLPMYVKGTLDSKVLLDKLQPLDGTFSFKSTNLVTQPKVMKKWIGKPLRLKIAVDTSGTLKKGKAYIDTKIKSAMANLFLTKMIYDIQNNTFTSHYLLKIPNLRKLYPLTDKKLNGSLVLKGQLSQKKVLKVTGSTKSLGGVINYTLNGDMFRSKISKVPLENILWTLGYEKNFLGKASGTANHHLKKKTGVINLNIASFQIKPSTLTNTVKMFIGKDPSRVIFSSTKFHADIKGDIVKYTLHAKGTRSAIDITNGRLNKVNNSNTAKFSFLYEKHHVYGYIKGTLDNPKVTLDTSALLNNQVKGQLEKVLDKKAIELFKNFSF